MDMDKILTVLVAFLVGFFFTLMSQLPDSGWTRENWHIYSRHYPYSSPGRGPYIRGKILFIYLYENSTSGEWARAQKYCPFSMFDETRMAGPASPLQPIRTKPEYLQATIFPYVRCCQASRGGRLT